MSARTPVASPRAALETRAEELARAHPEWEPWLALVRVALAAEEPGWEAAAAGANLDAGRADGAPLLDGASLLVDEGLARDWVRRLVRAAAGQHTAPKRGAADRVEPLALLEAAIGQDQARMEEIATATGADAAALSPVAQLAAMPLLQACGRQLAARVATAWSRGCCPVCGAWPSLAEVRGIDRARRLRCGRCGADWGMEARRCPFCGLDDHRELGALVPEQGGEAQRVETCGACRGYVKTLSTIVPWPGPRVYLEDLATVALDLVALERGFARPAGAGAAVRVRLQPHARALSLLGRRR
jgi:FdhE protein